MVYQIKGWFWVWYQRRVVTRERVWFPREMVYQRKWFTSDGCGLTKGVVYQRNGVVYQRKGVVYQRRCGLPDKRLVYQ